MNILTFIFIFTIVGIIAFVSYYFSKNVVIRRKIRKTAIKKISDFTGGEIAKITGKVELAGEPLTAPLSGRKCAYYYVLVEQRVSTGKSSHWKTLIEEEVSGKFVIRDGYSCAYINSQSVKSYLVLDMKYSSGFLNDATAELEKYLGKHNKESENFIGTNKTIRYKEGILEEGEKIVVVGKGEWKSSYHFNLPDRYDRVLAFSSTDEDDVYLSDDPDLVQSMVDGKDQRGNSGR
jgi:hypothetical protein